MAREAKVRVYVGTRKGGYVVESDRARRRWSVRGPFHAGGDVFHLAPDPRAPGTVYAAVNNSFWGPALYRSTNDGRSWRELPLPALPVRAERPPPDPSQGMPTYPIQNLWHIEPGPPDAPGRLYLGLDPAALYRSDDRGASWAGVAGLNDHPTRPRWNPGAGGMCLHTILLDPSDPKRMYAGISAAGTFRSDDGGASFRPVNSGVRVSFLPEKNPEFGQCVHDVALDSGDPRTAYRQDHDGIYVSHDRMESWRRIGRPLPYDFGFVTATAPALPGSAFFVPLAPKTRTTLDGGFQVYRWDDRPRRWTPLVRRGSFPGEYGMHREGLATDALAPAGLYVGTTTGQLFVSRDAGRSWAIVPHQFPPIQSVSVASPPARS